MIIHKKSGWKKYSESFKSLLSKKFVWNENKRKRKIDVSKYFIKYKIKEGEIIGDMGTYDDENGDGTIKIVKVADEFLIMTKKWDRDLIKIAISSKCLIKIVNDKGNRTFNTKDKNFFIKAYDGNYDKLIDYILKPRKS